MIIHGKEIPNEAFRAFGEAVYDAMDRLIEVVPAGEERLTLTEALAAVIAVPLGAELSLSTEELEVIAGHVAELIVEIAQAQRDTPASKPQ
jgi:hypothetical protein